MNLFLIFMAICYYLDSRFSMAFNLPPYLKKCGWEPIDLLILFFGKFLLIAIGVLRNMANNIDKETSRLQVRIPVDLKQQLDNAVKQKVMGMANSKSLMVSIGLIMLLNQMEQSTIDEVYVNEYIPFLNNNTSSGDD